MLNQFFKTSIRKKADLGVAFQFMAMYSGQTTFERAIAKKGETITPLQCHPSTSLSLTTSSSSTQPRHIISPAHPGCTSGLRPCWTCLKHLTQELSRRHSSQIPQVAHFDVEARRFNSEPLSTETRDRIIAEGNREPKNPLRGSSFPLLGSAVSSQSNVLFVPKLFYHFMI